MHAPAAPLGARSGAAADSGRRGRRKTGDEQAASRNTLPPRIVYYMVYGAEMAGSDELTRTEGGTPIEGPIRRGS